MKKQLVGVFVLAAVAVASGEVVTYEMFGAVGDGKTDDQKAIVAAHAAANTKGLPVRAADGKTYYIGGGDIIAEIRTDVDFGTAKFIIDDTAVKNRNRPVFRVGTTTKSFSVQGVKTLAREQKKLDVAEGVGPDRQKRETAQVTVRFPTVKSRGDRPRAHEYYVRAEKPDGTLLTEKRVYSPGINLPETFDAPETTCVFAKRELAGADVIRFTVWPANCWGRKGVPICS